MGKYQSKTKALLTQFQEYNFKTKFTSENSNAYAFTELSYAYETDLGRSVGPNRDISTPSIFELDMMDVD